MFDTPIGGPEPRGRRARPKANGWSGPRKPPAAGCRLLMGQLATTAVGVAAMARASTQLPTYMGEVSVEGGVQGVAWRPSRAGRLVSSANPKTSESPARVRG